MFRFVVAHFFCVSAILSILDITYKKYISTVPELRSRSSKRERYTKLHYTNRTAPGQWPFLLAGEFASPAAEI